MELTDVSLRLLGLLILQPHNQLHHLPLPIDLHLLARHGERRSQQPHRLPRSHPKVILRILHPEIILVDVERLRERNLVTPHLGILGMQRLLRQDPVALRDVGDGALDGMKNEVESRSGGFEVGTNGGFELDELDVGRGGGDSEGLDEGDDGTWRDSPSTKSDEGVQSGVVPSVDVVVLDELLDLPFGHDGSLDVESTVFGLTGLVDFESVAEPVVGFSSCDELGGAEGVAAREEEKKGRKRFNETRRVLSRLEGDVRDVLERINQAMSEVVGTASSQKKTKHRQQLRFCLASRKNLEHDASTHG